MAEMQPTYASLAQDPPHGAVSARGNSVAIHSKAMYVLEARLHPLNPPKKLQLCFGELHSLGLV